MEESTHIHTHTYIYMNHFVVHQKLAKHCKLTAFIRKEKELKDYKLLESKEWILAASNGSIKSVK